MTRLHLHCTLYTQLAVANLNASLVFYRQLLGLIAHRREVCLDQQLTLVYIYHFGHLAQTCNQAALLGYAVISGLQGRSLIQSDIAYLEDPDGYAIELVKAQQSGY